MNSESDFTIAINSAYERLANCMKAVANIQEQLIDERIALATKEAKAYANEEVVGSNETKRSARLRENFHNEYDIIADLEKTERREKLNLDLARISVEELRMHARILEVFHASK